VSRTAFVSLASAFAVVAMVAAQNGGGGGGGGGGFGGGEAGGSIRALTRFEQFTNRLRLDRELVTPVLEAAATEGWPVGMQMLTLQTQLANAILADQTEAEITAILDAYTAAASTMVGIEAKAFSQIYAMVQPNQRDNAPEAFEMMAGWFQPPPGPAAGRGGRAGGQGGAQ